jgi:hypothetical protein
MYVSVECGHCGGLNVVDISYEFKTFEFRVNSVETFDIFFEKYKRLVAELPEFPIEKSKLIKLIRQAMNVNTSLAYDILDRLKLDLGLYEKDGMIHSTEEYL